MSLSHKGDSWLAGELPPWPYPWPDPQLPPLLRQEHFRHPARVRG